MSKDVYTGKKELLQSCFPEIFERGEPNLLLLSSLLGVHPIFSSLLHPALEWGEPIPLSTECHSVLQGDNLSILKGMSAWKEKVKLIFIDPPYNTGKDFVYQDNWYNMRATEDFSRLHGSWLEMMAPRLRYAHALLREDGAIFICIDDHELAQLRMLCDSIFGFGNFVQNFLWLHGKGKKDKNSRTLQQYIVCYAKDKKVLESWKVKIRKQYEPVQNPDNDKRGAWFSGSISFSEGRSNSSHKNYFSITSPSGVVWTRQWLCSKEEMSILLAEGDIYFGPAPAFDRVPRRKMFPFYDDVIPPSVLNDCGTTRQAQLDLNAIFDGHAVFDYPKPVALCTHIIRMASQKGDIVLDFFAGSGTMLHAVLELEQCGEQRLCICVQSAEETPLGSVARKEGYNTIFDILKRRIEYLYNNRKLLVRETEIHQICSFGRREIVRVGG